MGAEQVAWSVFIKAFSLRKKKQMPAVAWKDDEISLKLKLINQNNELKDVKWELQRWVLILSGFIITGNPLS